MPQYVFKVDIFLWSSYGRNFALGKLPTEYITIRLDVCHNELFLPNLWKCRYHVYWNLSYPLRGTYKVRNEIETKRNETKSTKWKRNKTKPTKAKRNQRKQNEIENGRKNNRGLKEIKPIFTITMLDYFPHMSLWLSSGQDRIWSPLNKNIMHLFSGSLSFSLSGFF